MLRTLLDLVAKVRSVFTQIDQSVLAFQLKTGLRCLPGCGRCCPEGEVFTTVLEMLPAAHEILLKDEAENWFERIEARGPSGVCVFYRFDAGPGGVGHCGFYDFRPGVCRLFGFAAARNRLGEKIISTCKVLRNSSPEAARRAVEHQDEAPCFAVMGTRIYSQDPALGARLLPINQAFLEALMRLGLQMQVCQSENLGNTSAA